MRIKAKIHGMNDFFRKNPNKKNLSIVNVISMDQPSQSGDKFESFTNCINNLNKKHGVKKLVIILTDFLQRHYVGLNTQLSPNEIKKLAIEKGSHWVKNNRKALTFQLDIKIDFQIVYWDNVIGKKDYKDAFAKVSHLYQTDAAFRGIVDELSKSYADKLLYRHKEIANPPNFESCFDAAKNYLLEESAIWGPLLKQDLDFITYPGGKNKAVEYTYNHLFQSAEHSLPWLKYSFEKRHSAFSVLSGKLAHRVRSMDTFFFSKCRERWGDLKSNSYGDRRYTR
ncbi:hypothetical protein [Rickettsiella endosymbiont of Dermanyssus gallinae]|uniref:hypothetical protein n=1 Tax=Rickettsiella endosymbiont of Dermanyssus gallinae TaxID=2856608 RepID=UPI001C52EF23|nr:hypothetical protein [Rickettsiella endosymbiont of Dermanyssus gallinae]